MRVLSKIDAKKRTDSILPGIYYDCYLNFKKGTSYHGTILTKFAVKNVNNVFLDFSGKEITKILLNNSKTISEKNEITSIWTNGKLHLDPSWLVVGENTIEIQFKNDYNTDGNGLHTYTDLDKKQYVYTQTEPYNFNKVVPIFDQPDLKGYFRFYVMHPNDWVVISNNEKQAEFSFLESPLLDSNDFLKKVKQTWSGDFSGDSQTFSIFERTKRLSSYLFCLVMGPFECVDLPKEERYNDIPMKVYYRKSIEEFAIPQAQKILEISKKGIEFYENFFGHAYPFSKWDSAYCPEFTVGAMEYPGIVTYNDHYIFKEKNPSRSNISASCRVILHEMAHMWFGDLVTMQWWDGLWLNESFAEFMTYKSFSEIQGDLSFETNNAWSMMNSGKNWGYKADSNSTTHPIECNVVDTRKAEAIFDGITYSKGCSVLQQLYYLIGDQLFRGNIKNYFEEFKWKNTELKDLLRHMEQGTEGIDLVVWNKQWIETAGTNTVLVEWDPKKTGKQTIKLNQGVLLEDFATLRRHKLDLAFYKENGEIGEILTVDMLAQKVTEVEIENKNYVAVLPNANDWTFISIVLDSASRESFIKNLSNLEELAQLLIVRSLYSDVKQAKVKADVFINILLPALEKNLDNPTIVKEFGEFILSAISYIPHALRSPNLETMFETVWKLAEKVENETILSELQKLLMGSISNAKAVTLMYNAVYKENNVGKKMTINKKTSATIHYLAVLIAEVDDNIKLKCIEKITKESSENEAFKKRKLSVDVFLMSKEERIKFYESEVLNSKRTKSYIELIYCLLALRSKHNTEEMRKYFVEQYFKHLPSVVRNEDKQIIQSILFYALPYWEDIAFLKAEYERILPEIQEIKNEFAISRILTKIDDYKKSLKVFALYK